MNQGGITPDMLHTFGRFLILFGLVLAAVGLILVFSDKIPWIGKLPGDILIKKGKWTFYFPLATSILLSILITLLLNLFRK